MASVFRAGAGEDHRLDYPVWVLTVNAGNPSTGQQGSATYYCLRGTGNNVFLTPGAEAGLIAAIGQFFQSHDWGSEQPGFEFSSFAVTVLTEAGQQVASIP